MIILADSNINSATVTATNEKSFAPADNLKSYKTVKAFETTTSSTVIDLDFSDTEIDVNAVALCGTNLSESASIVLSYSDTDIEIPEATISLTTFTNFNQVFLLDELLERRFWRLSISDPDPQDNDGSLNIGFIYIGEYFDVGRASYPSTPTLNVIADSEVSATGSQYGQKVYNAITFSASAYITGATKAYNFLQIFRDRQTTDYILLIPYEDSLDNPLYRPLYGCFTSNSYAYALDGAAGIYAIPFSFSERF